MGENAAAASAAPAEILDPSGGANQMRVRAYNERLVMTLVRRHDGLSKAEIARRSGLSPQTVTVIIRALEGEGLLRRGTPLRGRVGQPSTPMHLNPDAVLSLGLKVGRRSAEIVLMDFVGAVRRHVRTTFAYPMPGPIAAFVEAGLAEIEAGLPRAERERIAGLGVAVPFDLWSWAPEVGAPQAEMDLWRDVDLQAEIARRVPYPVVLQNDATSACAAELVFGLGPQYPDFLYVFIGSFIGGGVVLNSALFTGRTGTAGAIGSLPVQGSDGRTVQLLKVASIVRLEKLLRAEGIDPQPLWYSPDDWVDFGPPLDRWIEETAAALAQAVVAAASLIDFSAAIVDGGFPGWVRTRIVAATREAVGRLDLQGVLLPDILPGAAGSRARSIGGACLPLFSRYLLDQNILFKERD